MRIRPFDYMTWAKAHYFDTEFSLVPSGMAWPTCEDLQVPDVPPFDEVPASGPGSLQEHVATTYDVPIDDVLCSGGSALTNQHVFAALLEAGDEVLIESPAYELFGCLASTLGVTAKCFHRRPENDFDLDIADIEAALDPKTKLIVFTTVHNPTGRLADAAVLRGIGELCERRGIWALASEVYLDFVTGTTVAADGTPPTRRFANHVHPRLLSSNSMTKVYGLGSVRIGWMFGDPAVVARCHDVREALAPLLPALPVAVTVEALRRRAHLLGRARTTATSGRAILREFLADADGFELVEPQAGIMAFVRVDGVTKTAAFSDWLRETQGVGVVPGEHFGAPGWLRIGYGVPQDRLREGLARLVRARSAWPGR